MTSFYDKGILKLASLSSPWSIKKKIKSNGEVVQEDKRTETENIKTQWHESLHISKQYNLSEMFYAINIWNWEYYHARKSYGWISIRSKWCVWLPIHYQKELYKMTSWNNTSTYSFVLDN